MPTATSECHIPVINKGNKKAEVLIYDQIGESFFSEGVTAKNFARDLKELGDVNEIDVRINSPGGSVFEGMAIYNTLKTHPATIKVHIDGAAFSMASGIAMAGDTINMAENALMMIHNPMGMAFGEAKDMRRRADILDKLKTSLAKAYVNRTGKSEEEISELMDSETWMDADEAVEFGFADSKTEATDAVASFDVPDKYKVPAYLTNVFANLVKPIKKGMNDMATDKTPAPEPKEPQPATVNELKALKGVEKAGSDFIVEQLANNATLEQAKDALNSVLLNQVEAAEAARKEAEEKIAKVKNHGVEPLDTKTPKDDQNPPEPVHFNNSREIQHEITNEMRQREDDKRFFKKGAFYPVLAMADVKRNRPELFEHQKA